MLEEHFHYQVMPKKTPKIIVSTLPDQNYMRDCPVIKSETIYIYICPLSADVTAAPLMSKYRKLFIFIWSLLTDKTLFLCKKSPGTSKIVL